MAAYLLEHRHEPQECATVFAAWKGFDSPLRNTPALCSCAIEDHRLWFVVDASDEATALVQLPRYLAERAAAVRVAEVPIP